MKNFILLSVLLFAPSIWASSVCMSLTQPKTATPGMFQSDSLDKMGKLPAKARWQKVKDADYYIFSITTQKNFKKSRAFKRTSRYMPLMVYPSKTYYWKVLAFKKDGTPVTKDSLNPNSFKTKYTGKEDLEFLQKKLAGSYEEGQFKVGLPTSEHQVACQDLYSQLNEKQEIIEEQSSTIETMKEQASESLRMPSSLTHSSVSKHGTLDWLSDHRVTIGTEMGALNFEQQFNDVNLPSLKASGVLFPSVAILYRTPRWRRMRFRGIFSQTIGDFTLEDDAIRLLEKDFNWLNIRGELDVLLTKFNFLNRVAHISASIGYGRLRTPYFELLPGNFLTTHNMNANQVSISLLLETELKNSWSYFANWSYTQILNQDTDRLESADLNRAQIFNVQAGVRYLLKRNFFLGLTGKWNMSEFDESLRDPTINDVDGVRGSDQVSAEVQAGFTF